MANDKIHVLLVEPEKLPRPAEIDSSLESMQQVVGGYIQAVYPFFDDAVLVCNEEGKLQGLPPNRLLREPGGKPYDVVCGTFFIAGTAGDDFTSLSQDQMEHYRHQFSRELILTRHKSHGRRR